MTMNTTKTLILAGFAAMSVGMGAAVAQESAGGVNAGPYETQQLAKLTQILAAKAAATPHRELQFGSSDFRAMGNSPVLQGGDGNGR
jgi:hypothetical protein